MKKFLFILTILLTANDFFSQAPKKIKKHKPITPERFAIPSKNFDTLYINDSDEVAKSLIDLWKKDISTTKPLIVLCKDIYTRDQKNYIKILDFNH